MAQSKPFSIANLLTPPTLPPPTDCDSLTRSDQSTSSQLVRGDSDDETKCGEANLAKETAGECWTRTQIAIAAVSVQLATSAPLLPSWLFNPCGLSAAADHPPTTMFDQRALFAALAQHAAAAAAANG